MLVLKFNRFGMGIKVRVRVSLFIFPVKSFMGLGFSSYVLKAKTLFFFSFP